MARDEVVSKHEEKIQQGKKLMILEHIQDDRDREQTQDDGTFQQIQCKARSLSPKLRLHGMTDDGTTEVNFIDGRWCTRVGASVARSSYAAAGFDDRASALLVSCEE
ncbi:hypothetical protein TorRG33x02_355040 [Trema orientale]|uniref:Uncharacterized protein n=1 Tax=Trema orientale TaxID=63057 RepID=A0A2P5A9X4_TREOI|nr:hypothetical protein TorRG33x02_355040 [Trema orientale]